MSVKGNKTAIGVFVVLGLVLLVVGISVFGSGMLFKRADRYTLFFDGTVKGLAAGAPVIFRGVKIGNVDSVNLLYDCKSDDVYIMVVIEVELSRVKGVPDCFGYPRYEELVESGLRARLESQSLVTGQLMVSFDFYGDVPANLKRIPVQYPELPTIPMPKSLFEIVQHLPIREIADNVNSTAAGLNTLVNSPDFQSIVKVAPEITGAARSLRLLLEYLEQHPESLLKGKSAE